LEPKKQPKIEEEASTNASSS
jgi:hypothetical protein